ncbi:unnamed protein product, partial [Musa acuminata var. zebrina]
RVLWCALRAVQEENPDLGYAVFTSHLHYEIAFCYPGAMWCTIQYLVGCMGRWDPVHILQW